MTSVAVRAIRVGQDASAFRHGAFSADGLRVGLHEAISSTLHIWKVHTKDCSLESTHKDITRSFS